MSSFIKTLIITGIMALSVISAFALESKSDLSVNFQSELSLVRGKILPMCAQLQAGKPTQSNTQLLSDIDSIVSDWNEMTSTYKDNPPAEYANDTNWKGYFTEALDNFTILKSKVEINDYKRATQFCGLNCGLFVTMNQVNGVNKLSDRMLMVRKNVKLMMDMVNAGNWKSTGNLRMHTDEMIEAMLASPRPENADKATTEHDLDSIKKAYESFVGTLEIQDNETTSKQFKAFMKLFTTLYPQYI